MRTGRPKGYAKTGGRKPGTPNKVTTDTKQWIQALIDNNRTVFERDLKKVDPEKRLAILEKLMNYVIPKQQSISLDEQISIEYKHLELLLQQAPGSALDELERRLMMLKETEKQLADGKQG